MELSVNIATNCDRCSHLLDIGFINQDFFCLYKSQITIRSKNVTFGASNTAAESIKSAKTVQCRRHRVIVHRSVDNRLSLTFSQRALTYDSGRGLQERRTSIWSSRLLISPTLNLSFSMLKIFLLYY